MYVQRMLPFNYEFAKNLFSELLLEKCIVDIEWLSLHV